MILLMKILSYFTVYLSCVQVIRTTFSFIAEHGTTCLHIVGTSFSDIAKEEN